MGQVFHGWQRKVGLATLMMALVFMGGWVRSNFMLDSMMLPARMHKTNTKVSVEIDALESAKGTIIWERAHEESSEIDADEAIDLSYPQWQSSNLPDFDTSKLKWRWRLCGFGVYESPHQQGAWSTYLFIPYWSIVVPLTLISAYLLLAKSASTQRVKSEGQAPV